MIEIGHSGECCGCDTFDITSTLLKYLLDRCCKSKRRILWTLRMVIGLGFSIIDFIVICVVNKDHYLGDRESIGLFASIICYIVLVYSVFIWLAYYLPADGVVIRVYKFFDMIMDVLLVSYTYTVSEVTDFFGVVCAFLAVVDILMALVSICIGKF